MPYGPRLCLCSLLGLCPSATRTFPLDDERYLAVRPITPVTRSRIMRRVSEAGLHQPPPAGLPADCTCISKPSQQWPNLAQINRSTQVICRPLSSNSWVSGWIYSCSSSYLQSWILAFLLLNFGCLRFALRETSYKDKYYVKTIFCGGHHYWHRIFLKKIIQSFLCW